MKKLKIIITGLFLLLFSAGLTAQDPPPPPGGGHGQSGDQGPGGNAPVGAGVVVLLGLGMAYGGKKVYEMRKSDPGE